MTCLPAQPLSTRAASWWRALTLPISAVAVAGCAVEPVVPASAGGVTLTFAPLSDGNCTATTNGTKQVPDGIASLVALWTAEVQDGSGAVVLKSGKAKASKAEAAGGKWEVKDIPATSSLAVQVYGCSAAQQVVYGGARDRVQIEAGKPQNAHIFLAPIEGLGCTGSPTGAAKLSVARSLAASAVLPNGDVLVAGGMAAWNGGTAKGEGSVALDVYESREGHFRPLTAGGKALQLSVGRIGPHVLPLAAGTGTQALVVGGTLSAKRIGDANLKLPLFSPASIKDGAVPALEAELVDVGSQPSVKAAAVKTGVGTALWSSALATGTSLVFAGGQSATGQVLDTATRVRELADVAQGGSGKTDPPIKLNVPRLKPVLLSFPSDGTVLVWGGAVPASGAADAKLMGELLSDTNQSQPLTVDGDAGLLADANLSTVGAVATYVERTAGSLTVLVAGGVPVAELGKGLGTDKAPAYLLTVNKATLTATVRKVQLPDAAPLRSGLFGMAVPLDDRRVLVGGGVVSAVDALGGLCGDSGGATECVLPQAWVVRVPVATAGDTAPLTLELLRTVDLSGMRFGMAVAPLPLGALIAGGQASAFQGVDGETLRDSGTVLTLPAAGVDPAGICP